MFENVIPYFVKLAIEQVTKESVRLLKIQKKNEYLSLIADLAKLSLSMQEWLLGKSTVRNPIKTFKAKAQRIETKADEISKQLWVPNKLNIVSVFNYAEQEKSRSYEVFEYQLKINFNLQRERLLDQVRGARLLKNNNDLGEEVEKIFLEYLNKNLDNDVLAVRGGHIFDINNNQSKQMDIIIIPSKMLSMCPSDTVTGKYNVLIDNVIAAISVKSTLNRKSFKDAWNDIQSIPVFKEKEDFYPNLNDEHIWPLCFILGANSESIKSLNRKWEEFTRENEKRPLQLFMTLDNGYSIAGNASWPLKFLKKEDEYSGSFHSSHELSHGLGLAWLLLSINARSAFLANKPLKSFDKYFDLIFNSGLKAGGGNITYTSKYHFMMPSGQTIKGNIVWGSPPVKWLNNNVAVCSIKIDGKRLVNEKIPISNKDKKMVGDDIPFESRWFDIRSAISSGKNGCRITEWIKMDNSYYFSQVIFD